MACAGITVGAIYDCDDPLVPFVRQRLLLGNIADIETITRSVTDDNIIEGITMKSTKAMFAFEGVKQTITAQCELVASDLATQYNHQVGLSVFDVSALQKQNLQGMATLEQFAIVENSHDTSLADSVFEVFGISRGMLPSELIRINGDSDTGGAYRITLITPDTGGKESTLVDSFFITDQTTTDAAVEALLTPAI